MKDWGKVNSTIRIHVPFTFSGNLDPLRVLTVGDQVASEHAFAAHSRASIRDGFTRVFSDVTIDRETGEIKIIPRFPLRNSDGSDISADEICSAAKEVLSGTRHAPYTSILEGVDCIDGKGIRIRMTSIPSNIQNLLTIPDLFIFDRSKLPISEAALQPTTGPYEPVLMSRDRIDFKLNPNYPVSLRANTVPRVSLERYDAHRTSELIEKTDAKTHDAIYLYGHAVTLDDLDRLGQKNYSCEQYPGEWLVYVGFGPQVKLGDRRRIGEVLDAQRSNYINAAPLAKAAYSIPPSDGPFGLSQEEYAALKLNAKNPSRELTRGLKLRTLDSWANLPIFREVIEGLRSELSIEIELVSSTEIERLFSEETGILLSPLGISQADPLSHLSFLSTTNPEFAKTVPQDRIAKVAILDDESRFTAEIKKIETDILEAGHIIPLAHFPGIVAIAPGIVRDESISYNWGIQAWALRLD